MAKNAKSAGGSLAKAGEKLEKANPGRVGRQKKLRELMNDENLGKADRGWLKQDHNAKLKKKRENLRVPPGKELAHRRGFEASKGYDYRHSDLKTRADHHAQHKLDKMGKLNKDLGKK